MAAVSSAPAAKPKNNEKTYRAKPINTTVDRKKQSPPAARPLTSPSTNAFVPVYEDTHHGGKNMRLIHASDLKKLDAKNMELATRRKPRLIVIPMDGNICSGKSTACELVKNKVICGRTIRVEFEVINQTLLSKYITDPKKYAFVLQMDTVSTRRHIMDMLPHRYKAETEVVLIDRSMGGDVAFALCHVLNGNINWAEFLIYQEKARMGDFWKTLCEQVTCFVYLHRTPRGCQESVAKRIGTIDTEYKEDYLSDIDNLHFVMMMRFHLLQSDDVNQHHPVVPPIHILDWRTFGDFVSTLEGLITNQGLFAPHQPRYRSSRLMFWDPNSSDKTKEFGSVTIPFDAPSDLEFIPSDRFPCLRPEYRVRHKQAWKDQLVMYLHKGLTVYLTRTNPKQKMLFDVIDNGFTSLKTAYLTLTPASASAS